ncbi:MAG: ABC transporter substrate-binding protein [Mobilitalea sp.]
MKNKFKIVFLILLIEVVVLTGCSLWPMQKLQYDDADYVEDTNSDLIVVGFSQLGSESDWRTANTKSIQNELTEENGFTLIFSNGRQKQENQIKAIRSFISQEVDYIVIAPVTEFGWDTVLEEAKEAGIPVIMMDRTVNVADDSLFTARVGSDVYEEGIKAGEWLEEYLIQEAENTVITEFSPPEDQQEAEIVNIVILEGTIDSTVQIGRSDGFNKIASQHKNWKIIAHQSGDFTKAKGKEVMVQLLQKHNNIDIVVSQNDDMTFGAIEAIHEAGLSCGVKGDITIISFDAVSEAFDRMEEGLINVDIECNPLQGPMIADIIERLEKGEEITKVSYIEEKVFRAENAAKDRIGRQY